MIGIVDWGLTAQETADAPNLIARGERVHVEVGEPGGQEIADALIAKGYNVREREGGIQAYISRITEGGLDGAADKRREGVVRSLPATISKSNDSRQQNAPNART